MSRSRAVGAGPSDAVPPDAVPSDAVPLGAVPLGAVLSGANPVDAGAVGDRPWCDGSGTAALANAILVLKYAYSN